MKTAEASPETLSALLPGPFVEGLVEPLFAEAGRAELAVRYLGAPLAHACAQACRNPAVDMGALHHRTAFESIFAHRMRARAVGLATELAAEGIEAVAFKGLATALSVYPHPVYRMLPDADFLFREADLPRLAAWLAARGYCTGVGSDKVRAWGVVAEASFAPIFRPDDPFVIDVHRAVDERPASLGLDAGLVFDRAETVATEWGPCRVAAREHGFAIAALNIYRDFYRPEALKGLFDACLIMSRFGDGLDWGHVEAVARRGRFVNRIVFFRALLEALGAGHAPVFEDRPLARWLRSSLAAVAENCRTLSWLEMSDGRKLLLEAALLDSPLATLGLHWRRLCGIVSPPMHYLPGVPVVTAPELEDTNLPPAP